VKAPVRATVLREQVPRNANGKIVKPQLRGHFAGACRGSMSSVWQDRS
jgi:hypothetical protein